MCMSYYKVMLVDDEEEVREAMKHRIDWEEIGFTVVASAENGEDALEKAEECDPDVVMTDIQMPFMDGLTMLRLLKQQIPDIKSVIFSGFDEFEYAKEAIRLEAEEYILKPIDAEELRTVFLRIKDRLDEIRNNRRDVDKLRQYYEQSLPMLKEQIIIGLLEGRETEADVKRYQEEYEIQIESAFYCVGVFAISGSGENHTLNKSLNAVSLCKIATEHLEEKLEAIVLNYLDSVVVLARMKQTCENLTFVEEMDKICKISARILGVGVVAGIGRVYGTAEAIHKSFLEAKDATHYRMFLDSNQAICIKDVEPEKGIDDYVEEKQIRHLIREVKVGTEESIRGEIFGFIAKLKQRSIHIAQLQLFYVEFLVELSRLARGHQLHEDINTYDINIREDISGYSSLDELGERIFTLCIAVHDKINSSRMDSTRKLAADAKQYIADHYADSGLSVEDICSHLGVGTSYFSSVFKKDTGMSFVTYLTQARMNEAQRLLDTTNEKSYVIAGMVGYDEPNYFSYVFKKMYGVSPSKYRQKE